MMQIQRRSKYNCRGGQKLFLLHCAELAHWLAVHCGSIPGLMVHTVVICGRPGKKPNQWLIIDAVLFVGKQSTSRGMHYTVISSVPCTVDSTVDFEVHV